MASRIINSALDEDEETDSCPSHLSPKKRIFPPPQVSIQQESPWVRSPVRTLCRRSKCLTRQRIEQRPPDLPPCSLVTILTISGDLLEMFSIVIYVIKNADKVTC